MGGGVAPPRCYGEHGKTVPPQIREARLQLATLRSQRTAVYCRPVQSPLTQRFGQRRADPPITRGRPPPCSSCRRVTGPAAPPERWCGSRGGAAPNQRRKTSPPQGNGTVGWTAVARE